jgi:hypothetical protein
MPIDRTVAGLFEELQKLSRQRPSFIPGASEDEIRGAELALDWLCPPDLRLLWKLTNGIKINDGVIYSVLSTRSKALLRHTCQDEVVRHNSDRGPFRLSVSDQRERWVMIGYLADPFRGLYLSRCPSTPQDAERAFLVIDGVAPELFAETISELIAKWYEDQTGCRL